MFRLTERLQIADTGMEYHCQERSDRLRIGLLIRCLAMTCRGQIRWLLAAALLLGTPLATTAANAEEPVRIAVASNFAVAMRELVYAFSEETGGDITVSSASTGKLFAQIRNGAPFDAFFAADVSRPQALEVSGHAAAGSRFTYALGELVLWSADRALSDQDCRTALLDDDKGKLAIANPRTAPYGVAARQALDSLGLLDSLQGRLVVGENVAQTLQFAASGNARFALVSAAQLQGELVEATGCHWTVPSELYEPVEQQAVLLNRRKGAPAAQAFFDFVRSDAGRTIIARQGYTLPANQ